MGDRITCSVCPRHCLLADGQLGACGVRRASAVAGDTLCDAYGRLTSVALDPIEKKPLARFLPGSYVLSVGGYGCTMRCPFCQNYQISQAGADDVRWEQWEPAELVETARRMRQRDARVVGLAYTYNEPLAAWEYVRDCAVLAREAGLKNVLVSSANASTKVVQEVVPLLDAANIDLKGFNEAYYRWCGGDFATVKENIAFLARCENVHLELTCLVVPGKNDSETEMDALARWVAELDPQITLHVSRFFGRYKLVDVAPTPVATVYRLADVARRHLAHVYTGNC